jgi:hypothetical protein
MYNVKINFKNEKSQITNNATLNNQMGVDNIVTRMKSNKRKRNNTYNQTRKKSHKSQTQTSHILSSAESLSHEYYFTPKRYQIRLRCRFSR